MSLGLGKEKEKEKEKKNVSYGLLRYPSADVLLCTTTCLTILSIVQIGGHCDILAGDIAAQTSVIIKLHAVNRSGIISPFLSRSSPGCLPYTCCRSARVSG